MYLEHLERATISGRLFVTQLTSTTTFVFVTVVVSSVSQSERDLNSMSTSEIFESGSLVSYSDMSLIAIM